MDLLKTPSVQSLLDSDLESVGSLQYLDIEELDEVEYALPASEAPTLAEALSAEEGDVKIENSHQEKFKTPDEPSACSALQVDFMQAVSQQITQAQERSSAGAATALSVGTCGKLTVGTAHGHLLSFFDQTLRWVCDSNADKGAVACLCYNKDSTRLLAGYARGLICQYESIHGILLRRVTLGGETWGTLRVTWAGTSGLALDTGGSVWLIKFSRPLGVRSARTSCLFSGARGEVVAMTARDARILALATLSRVIIVAGGRAAGVRLGGPPDTLPVLEWSDTDDRVLVCGRSKTLQWLTVSITGSSISLRPLQRVELKAAPLWLGWLGGSLAIFDADENLRLWGNDYDKPLDLSHIEPVYASAFFKGLWTDGRVSRAMCSAGVSALGGACVVEGALSLLGRRGIVRVKPRDLLARARAFISSGHHLQALRLLCSAQGLDAKPLANEFILNLSERQRSMNNRSVAEQTIKLCLKYNLHEELWSTLWEQCSCENAFVEALGDAAVRGELSVNAPSPDSTQALIERLAEFEPTLVERVVASLPLTSLDPHRASVFTRTKKLWRGVGAIAAALGGSSGAMRELAPFVVEGCPGAGGRGAGVAGACGCAGDALVLAAADALGGRGAAGRPLPDHAQPSARHDALHTLLAEDGPGGKSILRVVVAHDASAAVRLLEQSAREPPFAGPLGKQNRLRVARALLAVAPALQDSARAEVVEFIAGQISSGALPTDQELLKTALEIAATTTTERSDRAWLALILRSNPKTDRLLAQRDASAARPRVRWRIEALLERPNDAIKHFFLIQNPSETDIDEFFEYLRTRVEAEENSLSIENHLPALIQLKPLAAAALMPDTLLDSVAAILQTPTERTLEFGECLLETGRLRGDAASAHLKGLCVLRPKDVADFLKKNPGVVRPEDALAIVQESKVSSAEAICLEAAGDASAALDAILRNASDPDPDIAAGSISAGAALCARVCGGASRALAAELWARVLRAAPKPSPALLLEASAYVPVALLLSRAQSPAGALALVACAAAWRRAWGCGARAAARDAHSALARALALARAGLRVSGACTACERRLANEEAVQCGRSRHAALGGASRWARCGRCARPAVPALVARAAAVPALVARAAAVPALVAREPPRDHALTLVAPPRPDLEGVV